MPIILTQIIYTSLKDTRNAKSL